MFSLLVSKNGDGVNSYLELFPKEHKRMFLKEVSVSVFSHHF
jgi:hypothetical protein